MRRLALLVIVATTMLLSGCWDYLELETLSFAMGAGIDAGPDDSLVLSVETLKVEGGQPTQMTPYVTKAPGLTMFNALRNLTNLTGKQMFFGHSHAVVFSEEYAKRGVGNAVGFMQRDVGIRTNTWLFVVRGASAEDVLKADAPLGTSVGHYLDRVMQVQHRNPTSIPIQIWEFNRALSEEGLRPVLPAIELVEIDDSKVPMVEGCAVFKQDKLAGWLDAKDARILSYLRSREVTGVIVTELEFKGEVKRVAAEVTWSKVKLEPKWENEEVRLDIQFNLGVDLHEIGFADFDYSQPDLKRILEEGLARQLKEDTEHLMHTLQKELESDVLGLGNLVKKKMPSHWRKLQRDWEREFSKVPVTVKVAVLMTETGTLAKPLKGRL
ncbi:MAG: hypothetical protein AA931_04390 [Peptococcaceae bacterium 1109]|nr:MAG: hypothetical protein AA931_04390 [Peptococcaceae bacterium 1109]